jgi:hypothetical protein
LARTWKNAACEARVEVVPRIADISAESWDACANPEPAFHNPFITHGFLKALEDAGTVGGNTGWTPRHLVLRDTDNAIAACAPCYLKSHSRGEYVFDHAWSDAYARAGGQYYPKLQIAVPFTPVPGRRLLVRPGPEAEANEALLAGAAAELANRNDLSGVHVTFMSEGEHDRLGAQGFLQRTDQQFHWRNPGYGSFDDFLASLASRKRKAVRKEREQALADGLEVEWVRGRDITEAHWDAFFAFYMDTGGRKWGRPYLNRRFFSLLGERMAERIALVMCRRDGRWIAGALNLIGADTLYGRYWGCVEEVPFLHFEACYYQAIEHAIARGLGKVEAGAQGPHKIARGYLPCPIYSAHWIRDAGFRAAIDNYLKRERREVEHELEHLAEFAPFRRGEGQTPR